MSNNLDNLKLRSEEIQEILTRVPHWMIRWGNFLFLSLILILLLISWFVKYPDIILTDALITTMIPPQKEYSKITAKLNIILVKNNQDVKKNQSLAILENTANYKDVLILKSIIDTLTVNTKNFYFPLENLPILFLGDIDSKYTLFENNYIEYQLNKELKPFSYEVIANNYSISELKKRLISLKSQQKINKTELNLKNKSLSRQNFLFSKGVISLQDYENKQLEYEQAKRNYKNFESSISQIREAISNANKTFKGNEIREIKEERNLLKNVIQSFNQLKKAVKDWEFLYVFKSTINGNVAFLDSWSVNQTVNQGDLVFTIIPSNNSGFIAKLKAPILNSGKIKVGQKVNIKLENYPEIEFGVINGVIENVFLIPDKEDFYLVNVTLPKDLITSYKKTLDFKQEMRGTAEIITEDLRLIERFFYQFKKVLSEK